MSNKKSRRSSRRHYRQVNEPVVQPVSEKDVSELLSGGTPFEASKSLKWQSGKPNTVRRNNVNWEAVIWLTVAHLGALAAPWTFSWSGLGLLIFLHWVCGCIGVTLGFHRLLTHGSFNTPRWMRRTIATIGCLAGEGPPLQWVAIKKGTHIRRMTADGGVMCSGWRIGLAARTQPSSTRSGLQTFTKIATCDY
jgi:hypothetical protein